MSGGFPFRASEIGPINIRSHFLAPDSAFRFALDVNTKRLTNRLLDRNCLAEIADRCIAPTGEIDLIGRGKAIDVGKQRVHADTLPNGNIFCNTVW